MSTSTTTSSLSNGRELSRLLSAAVVNKRFCKLLLTNPAIALANGYNGEFFHLAKYEKELVLSIRAKTLEEFASQIINKTTPSSQNIRSNELYNQTLLPVNYSYCG
jgi:hypothetical protein